MVRYFNADNKQTKIMGMTIVIHKGTALAGHFACIRHGVRDYPTTLMSLLAVLNVRRSMICGFSM
jgi:hypothetical protein